MVNECPEVLLNWPVGFEPLAGVRNRKKATVKLREKKRHFGFFL